MLKTFLIYGFLIVTMSLNAQLAKVEYNYNTVGDCILGAQNNSKTPVYLHLWFTNLANSSMREPLPYVKKLDPGYNQLFTLLRESESGSPQFSFQTKTYRSDPLSKPDLKFQYLVPFEPGSQVKPVDVKDINGFWGTSEPKSWKATGFQAKSGTQVYAARRGQVVEIAGASRTDDSQFWYNTWTNAVTLLQPDGSLITYKNVIDPGKKLSLNQTVHAGEMLGEVANGANEIIILIYYNTLSSNDLQFIIPLFLTSPGKSEIVNPAQDIEVVHPDEIRGQEMSKREQKQYLRKK